MVGFYSTTPALSSLQFILFAELQSFPPSITSSYALFISYFSSFSFAPHTICSIFLCFLQWTISCLCSVQIWCRGDVKFSALIYMIPETSGSPIIDCLAFMKSCTGTISQPCKFSLKCLETGYVNSICLFVPYVTQSSLFFQICLPYFTTTQSVTWCPVGYIYCFKECQFRILAKPTSICCLF